MEPIKINLSASIDPIPKVYAKLLSGEVVEVGEHGIPLNEIQYLTHISSFSGEANLKLGVNH